MRCCGSERASTIRAVAKRRRERRNLAMVVSTNFSCN